MELEVTYKLKLQVHIRWEKLIMFSTGNQREKINNPKKTRNRT